MCHFSVKLDIQPVRGAYISKIIQVSPVFTVILLFYHEVFKKCIEV